MRIIFVKTNKFQLKFTQGTNSLGEPDWFLVEAHTHFRDKNGWPIRYIIQRIASLGLDYTIEGYSTD